MATHTHTHNMGEKMKKKFNQIESISKKNVCLFCCSVNYSKKRMYNNIINLIGVRKTEKKPFTNKQKKIPNLVKKVFWFFFSLIHFIQNRKVSMKTNTANQNDFVMNRIEKKLNDEIQT